VSNIRLGNEELSWTCRRSSNQEACRFRWSGTAPLTLDFQPQIPWHSRPLELKINGERQGFSVRKFGPCKHIQIQLTIEKEMRVDLMPGDVE